jgi:hypothetical protein
MALSLNSTIRNKASRFISKLQARAQAKQWPDKSIVFYASDTPYQWSPEKLLTGIGGAEGRVIHLAREWVKQGYQVTVYNSCGDKEGIYDGVQYLNHQKFNPYDHFDILIVWHFAWRIKFPIKANRVWLDLGKGVLLPEEVTYEKLKHYHKIFCKNNFHRSTLPEIPDEQIVILPNGIDSTFAELFESPKDPNKIIYASNYIRGLERMLEFGWPIIRQAVPTAELHIYYGWPREPDPAWREKMMSLMNQPGVIEHGKVGRQQLMKEKSTSILHYYGCTFAEIDCNTVRESALVGCVPVTTDYAGLRDKDYCVKVPGNPYEQDTQEALAYTIVELLKQPDQIEEIRKKFSEKVQEETWENIARSWLEQQ